MESNDGNENDMTNVVNVKELKKFFQNQKLPVMGFQNINQNVFDNNSPDVSHSGPKLGDNESGVESNDCPVVRPLRRIPRPPKPPINCSDINVSTLIKVLPNIQTERPVPKPRKSLLKNVNNDGNHNNYRTIVSITTNKCDNNPENESVIHETNQCSNPLTLSSIKEMSELSLNERNIKSHKIHCLSQNSRPINDQNCNSSTSDGVFDQTMVQSSSHSIILSDNQTKKQSSAKSKKPFKSFLKRSKLLSLRRKSGENSDKNKFKLLGTKSDPYMTSEYKPVKPTRSPPPPPLLRFRPAAPLPPEANEDYYGDTLNANNCNSIPNNYELYNDSVETEQIYCSLDNDEDESDFYEGINDYDDGVTGHKHLYSTYNYYEDSIDNLNSDCDRIYEVLPFEKDSETDCESIGSNLSVEEKKIECVGKVGTETSTLERKRELRAVKLRKKFNLTGEEIPVNAGIVKEDNKGSRYDLFVRKGETVLILRMEGNPPGKWLAKNERAKVGFVDLANISFDAESVKCIIKSLASHKP